MNTILVPTDFKPSSNGGIALGAVIAEKSNASLTLQHNVMTLLNWSEQDTQSQLEHPEVLGKTLVAERQIAKMVKDGFPKNLTVNPIITQGITADQIVRTARNLDARLIVMGSHGIEDADRNFIGSTAQKVVRSASCPVLLAKKEVSRSPRKIVFPFTFTGDVLSPFNEIVDIAEELSATIDLLFVNTPTDFRNSRLIYEQMKEFTSAYPSRDFEMHVYNHSDVVTGIVEHSKAIEADLIALVSHDRLHQPHYQIGITESVAFHSDIPVLSVNVRAYKSVFV